jgi:peptidoglycan/LPS O-acetylase OafA/YrhL
VGSQCYKLKAFESNKRNIKAEMIVHSTGWIPVCIYIAGVIYQLVSPDEYLISKSTDILIVRLCYLLSLAYFIYAMINGFQNYLNKRSNLWDELNRNSYGVYIIHVIILGVIATYLLDVNMHPIIKFLTLTIATYIISNLLLSIYKRIKRKLLEPKT